MRTVIIHILIFSVIQSAAQRSFYESIQLGKFNVGYTDSLIYDNQSEYNQFGYSGLSPIFLKVWHPEPFVDTLQLTMRYDDFQFIVNDQLHEVRKKLKQHTDAAFLKYAFIGYDSNEMEYQASFGSHSAREVYEQIKNIRTKSYPISIPENISHPVILYHHGAGSFSHENYLMAEYFASRGFVFISAAYHLPYESLSYGDAPPQDSNNHRISNLSELNNVLDFAKSIAKQNNIYYIGHSWGAGRAFGFLHDKKIDGLVAMETTAEYFDVDRVKEIWPGHYSTIQEHKNDYDFPILHFGKTYDKKLPFPLFKVISAPTVHVSAKTYLYHGSYTTICHTRHLMNYKFPQADSDQTKKQLEYFVLVIKMIDEFIASIESNRQFDDTSFRENFNFHYLNWDK